MSGAIQLRLRHPLGDLEAFEVLEGYTVQQVKEAAFTQWPSGAGEVDARGATVWARPHTQRLLLRRGATVEREPHVGS